MVRAKSLENLAAGATDLAAAQVCSPRQPSLFARLSDSECVLVLERAHRCSLEPAEIVFAQGTFHDGIFLIESGLIRTFYTSLAGRDITLAYWQPGNIVGTPEVFDGGIHVWSGIAVERSEVLAFEGSELRRLVEKIPALGIGLIEALSFKGRCLSMLVQMLGTRSVSERLIELLCTLGELHGVSDQEGITVGPPFTHEVLAHMVGASRQWVTITLNRLQTQGIVRIRKRHLVILRENLPRQRSPRTVQEADNPNCQVVDRTNPETELR